jgi:hypothetical protein
MCAVVQRDSSGPGPPNAHPGLERAGWCRRDWWPRAVGRSCRATGDGDSAEARHVQHHSRHDLASRCGPVRCHVPRIGVELRRPRRRVPSDRHRANDRRPAEWPDLRHSVRVRGVGRLLAYRPACEPAAHHESDALIETRSHPRDVAVEAGLAQFLRAGQVQAKQVAAVIGHHFILTTVEMYGSLHEVSGCGVRAPLPTTAR